MNNSKLINEQSIAAAGKSSLKLRKRQRVLHAFLAMTAIVVLAGCVYDGYHGGYYGPPGFFIGGVHHGGHFGGHHSIGHGGFGHR